MAYRCVGPVQVMGPQNAGKIAVESTCRGRASDKSGTSRQLIRRDRMHGRTRNTLIGYGLPTDLIEEIGRQRHNVGVLRSLAPAELRRNPWAELIAGKIHREPIDPDIRVSPRRRRKVLGPYLEAATVRHTFVHRMHRPLRPSMLLGVMPCHRRQREGQRGDFCRGNDCKWRPAQDVIWIDLSRRNGYKLQPQFRLTLLLGCTNYSYVAIESHLDSKTNSGSRYAAAGDSSGLRSAAGAW